MNKKTKIIATLGPASESSSIIKELILSGVDLFRFNTKHNTPEWHRDHINLVQEIADEQKTAIGIILDLQGPEMRLSTRDEMDIVLEKEEEIEIFFSLKNKNTKLAIPYKKQLKNLNKGDAILINDGIVELTVVKTKFNSIIAKAVTDSLIKNHKSVNLPGVAIDLPSLIEKDLAYLEMTSTSKVDFVALSFVRNKKDITTLKNELQKRNLIAGIIAKIENNEALQNIDEIIDASDAVMVARGDLGVEVSIEKIAEVQKRLIEKCRLASKPVITATQMLESMIENPRPTNAEAVDIANAVYLGSDAIMLSGETATGKYPVKTVKTMVRIASYNEGIQNSGFLAIRNFNKTEIIGGLVGNVLRETNGDIDKIIAFTQSGYTARVVSSLRPRQIIIAATEHQETLEKLTLSYGVKAAKVRFPSGRLRNPEYVIEQLIRKNALKKGERVIMIHGTDWKKSGATNSLALIDVE